jgi:tetratricopeptide (TPR) repeat protein
LTREPDRAKSAELMRLFAPLLGYAFLLAATLGCVAGPRAKAPGPSAPPLEFPTTVVTPSSEERVDHLLKRAEQAAALGRDAEAITLYQRVITVDLDGRYRKGALFGLGFVQDRSGHLEEATDAYLRVVALGQVGDVLCDEARVRAVRLLLFLDRAGEAEETAQPLDPATRGPLEQAALRAARAEGHLSRGEDAAAEAEITRGRAVLEGAGFGQLVEVPLDVAALEFARGELLAKRAAALRFSPLPTDFARVLEQRCQLILDAQGAYSEAMKSKSAQYAAKSGVQVGELYRALHADLVTMERPPAADTADKRILFEGALRLRYSILLRKARAMMQGTVDLIERTGEGGVWANRAREALGRVAQAERAEETLLDSLPVSRRELEAALRDLEAKARSGPPGG